MKRRSLGNHDTEQIAGNTSGVFGRDLLKAGSDFRDVLMDSEPSGEKKTSRRSRVSNIDFPTLGSRESEKNESRKSARVSADSSSSNSNDRFNRDDRFGGDDSFKREKDFTKASPQSGEHKVRRRTHNGSEREARGSIDQFKGQLAWKFGLKVLGVFLLLCAIGFAAFQWSKPVTQFFAKPIKKVAVEGEFHFLTNARAMDLIYTQIDGHFLQLNLEKLKEGLESDPWIEHVYLNRRWPDTLVVKISEQKPIARWDQSGFVNQSGDLIRVKSLDPVMGLPWLKGDEANAREIMQQYQDLSTLLRSRSLEILGLECDSKKSWRIHLKSNIEIAVGRDQVMEKMDRFLIAYDTFLGSVWKDVEAIDLRYSNGVSVRWLPDSEMAKKYLKPEVASAKKK